MQKLDNWLYEMKNTDEAKRMEEEHQKQVSRMINSVDGSTGFLHEIAKPTAWRGGGQILTKEEADAKPLARHWQCGNDVQEKPWKVRN